MTQKQAEADPTLLNEAAVADYLRDHPDFFARHDYLLGELELPHTGAGKAVSLIERQVSILREQRQELKRKLQQLTQTARDNEHLLSRIERLILLLMAADDAATLLQHLEHALREDFHADAVALRTWTDATDPAGKLFERIAQRGEAVCGHIAPNQAGYLFGKEAEEIASGAVLPLFSQTDGHCFGVVGIGSVDPRRFHAEMGTTFLNYLGAVLARLLEKQPGR